jgi:serine/threonine protein kinase
VKVINAELAREPEFRDRFRREVEAARRVPGFCTAPVRDAGLDQDPPWVATDFIDGPTLQEAVSERGRLRGADLHALAVGIAQALSAIHEARLIHRDLKPSNVLLSPVGPRVIDFGIARALDATGQLTRVGTVIGTPGYIAPELLAGGRPFPAADVFCWGAVVAYAGMGRSPFTGADGAEINDQVQHAEPDLEELEPYFRRLVARALAKNPAARPAIPQVLSELTGTPPAPRRTGDPRTRRPPPPTGNPRTRRPSRSGSHVSRHLPVYVTLGAIWVGATTAASIAMGFPPLKLGFPSLKTHSSGSITNNASGLCIDTNGPQGSGVRVQVRGCGNYSGQRWSYNQTTDHLVNPPSGLCLDTAGTPAPGVSAVLHPCGNFSGQGWYYNPGTGHFQNLASGLCLDTARRPAEGVALVTDLCGDYASQSWHR